MTAIPWYILVAAVAVTFYIVGIQWDGISPASFDRARCVF